MSKAAFVAAIAGSVVALDQLTKWLVRRDIPLHDAVPVVPGFFAITHASNPGGAFSLFAGAHEWIRLPFFLLAATIAIGVLMYFVRQIPEQQRWLLFAVAGVLGGAIGNLIDRIAFGHVTDFLLVYWRSFYWPAFNVADSFISVGVTILILHSLFASDSSHESHA
ncbi:MAG: signal peptidase II [Deltaproteobacteria bacterium]|nr:signal peptidase II [Deltaproteobacteria bacterium]